jgi:hypothetical protein
MMAVSTATNVAELESEVLILRGETDSQRVRIAVLEAENDQLKIANARLELAIRDEIRKSAEVETIINQMSIGLVGAIEKMRRNREVEKQIRKMEQTDHIIGEIMHSPPPHKQASPVVDHAPTLEEELAEEARTIAREEEEKPFGAPRHRPEKALGYEAVEGRATRPEIGSGGEDSRMPGVWYERKDAHAQLSDRDARDLDELAAGRVS